MNWKGHVAADPAILGGRPTVEGTRISATLIIQRFTEGWTESL